MASAPPSASVQAAMNQYRQLVQESQRLATKISELEMDRNEHRLVEETLVPLDPGRRAYRLVGSILVERNVGEVLPSVTSNRENLDKSITALREKLGEVQKQAVEIKVKYNLQVDPSR